MNMHGEEAGRRTARLFRNGRSQAVRIPKEWEFEGVEVTMEKASDGSLIIAPARGRPTPREVVEWLRRQPRLEKSDLPVVDDGDMLPLDDVEL
ncbi:antitoxin [Nitratireductor sp. GCM10026969]|uniref:antitoxin n=1 Tax=Nitratireductor sp. GCM10026969 TaxID=3252645 RepID=UPI00360E943B